MAQRVFHYAIESIDGFSEPHMVPVCGYNFHGRKKLTEDWREVTCRECRKLCGFEDRPVEQPATRLAA